MAKKSRSKPEAVRVADELIARAMVVLQWPIVESRVTVGPDGPALVLAPSKEWSREAALKALKLAYELRVLAFELLCPPPEPRTRSRARRAKSPPV